MIAGPGEAKRSLSQRTRSNKCHRRKSGWMVERHCLLLATLENHSAWSNPYRWARTWPCLV